MEIARRTHRTPARLSAHLLLGNSIRRRRSLLSTGIPGFLFSSCVDAQKSVHEIKRNGRKSKRKKRKRRGRRARQNDPISAVLAPSRDDGTKSSYIGAASPPTCCAASRKYSRALNSFNFFFFLPSKNSLHEISILVYIRANNQVGIYIASPFHI